MMKNHKLAKSIQELGLYEMRRQLEYKSSWYGRELVFIDRFFPSSKTCSCCGWKNNNLKLSDREFICEECGLVIDRDENAAINIEKEGIDWEYEPNTFKLLNGVRYTPDFFLPKENLWIDVKGQLTEKHKIKHKLFREFGYDLKLVFIEELKSRLGISYSKFKKDWDRNKV